MTTGSRRIESAAFFSGIRMTIFLKTEGSIGGMSEKSMSSSFIRRKRAQSVPDFRGVDVLFMSVCLADGDDSNSFGVRFREDHYD